MLRREIQESISIKKKDEPNEGVATKKKMSQMKKIIFMKKTTWGYL